MKDSYYTLTVPLFVRALKQVDHLLAKTEAYVLEQGVPESEILEARLAPDMFAFTKQVQVVCDNAKGAVARLTGAENPAMADTEVSLAELRARIEKTIAFISSFTPEQFEGAAERKAELPYFKDKHFTGHDYLTEYVLPNFFFHYVTIYGILRMKGLAIGKGDYMGPLPLRDN